MDSVLAYHQRRVRQSNEINLRDRCALSKWSGKLLIVLTLISFIFVGLILNTIQLILCLTVRLSSNYRWRRWHKLVNGHLIYMLFTQPTFLIYYWTRVNLTIYVGDINLIEDVKNEILGIVISNHTYELDWLMCILLADQVGNIGSYKCFAKDELKWLPVIGWSFWMSDLIYVKREWNQDKVSIERKLNELLVYDQILLGIFAEGTRLTKEKYTEAIEFANSKGLQPYKYHLFPRTRGFAYTLRHYLRKSNIEKKSNEKSIKLYNLEIVLPDLPEFKNFLEGSYIKADVFCEEISISDEVKREAIESNDAENCTKLTELLYNIYRRKDELIDEYWNEGRFHVPSKKFPKGGIFPLKKPFGVALHWILFMSSTYGTFIYLATTNFAKSKLFWTVSAMLLMSGMFLLRRIEKESKPNNSRMLGNKTKQNPDTEAT